MLSLSWQANLPDPPLFSRQKFEWKIDQRSARGFDDIVSSNTQSGSQAGRFFCIQINRVLTLAVGRFQTCKSLLIIIFTFLL